MKHEYVITFHTRQALWERVVDTQELAVAQEEARLVKEEFGNATLARRPAGAKGIFPNWDDRKSAAAAAQPAVQSAARVVPFAAHQRGPAQGRQ